MIAALLRYELKGDMPQCLNYLEMYAEKFPDRYQSFVQIGDIYKTTGEFDKSITYYKKALLLEPASHYQLALLYHDMDEEKKALEHLNKALAVWDKAQPDYKPAHKARAMLTEWQ